MSSENTKSYFEQSQLWQSTMLPYQKQVLADIIAILPPDVKSILDVGCGNGLITNALPEEINVVGFDRSEAALRYVQRQKVVGDINNLPFEDESFDLVMANDIIEHLTLEEREQALKELARVASKYVIITVPFLEDLNQGMVQCADCQKYYHVNHHIACFDIDNTQNLLNSFGCNCIKQVLSGDISNSEPGKVIFLKRILKLEFASTDFPMCQHCGSNSIANVKSLNYITDKLVSDLCFKNPNLIDWCERRTECISLYSKQNIKQELPNQTTEPGFIDIDEIPLNLPLERLSNNYIDFKQDEIFRKSFIPRFSRLPYYVCENVTSGGVHLSEGQRLLIGFFCPPSVKNQDIELNLSGMTTDQEAQINIANYSNNKGYHSSLNLQITGEFSRKVTISNTTFSIYGLLFEITVNHSSVLLLSASIENVEKQSVVVYNNSENKARFWQVPASNKIYLSLPAYGKHIIERNWMYDWHILKNNKFPTIANNIFPQLINLLATEYDELKSEDRNFQEKYEELESEEKKLQKEYQALKEKYAHLLLSRIKRKILSFGRGSYESFNNFRNKQLKCTTTKVIDTSWQKSSQNVKSFLMICHDQDIDRRIIQQANALQEQGWLGKIVALSFDNKDYLDECDGVGVHRISLDRIVPDCQVYWRYQNRQRIINWWGRGFSFLSKANWFFYKLDLKITYRSSQYNSYPLPFDYAFYAAAKHYPANIVIAHDLPALEAAATLTKKWNVPLIYDAHELYSEQKAFSNFQKQILDRREREYAKECTKIITVSPSFAEVIAKKNNVPAPEVILNVTKSNSQPETKLNLFHDRLNIPYSHKLVLYQGGIAHNRNLENLVKGFTLLKRNNVHLIFLGSAQTTTLNKLKQIADQLLDRQIHFLPPVSQAELLRYTSSADFGIIPYPPCDINTKYCMPNKMFEYIQASLPILANDLIEVGRIFQKIGGGGLITNLNSPKTVKEGIEKMLVRNLDEDRKQLSNVRKQFSWETEKYKYIQIIENLMEI